MSEDRFTTSSGDKSGGDTGASADGLGKPNLRRFGPFVFDVDACRLSRDGVDVHLTPKAATVLCHLLQHPGELISKDEFLETVWEGVHVREESLTQAISVIRQMLGDSAQSPQYIQTVSGEGYRFIGKVAPVTECAADGRPGPEALASVATSSPSRSPLTAPAGAARRPDTSASRRTAASHRRWRLAAALMVLVALVGIVVVRLDLWSPAPDTSPPPPSDPGVALQTSLAEWHFPGANHPPSFALSPDGEWLAFLGRGEIEGSTQLFLKRMNNLSPRALPGTESAYPEDASWVAVFSPGSGWLAFTKGRTLWKVSVAEDDEPVPVCDLPDGAIRGASWGGDDTIVFGRFGAGLVEIGTRGDCAARTLTAPDRERDEQHYWPQVLPDGEHVLFNVSYEGESWNEAEIAIVSRETGARRTLDVKGAHPRYVPSGETGHLLFARRGVLFAAAFDVERLEVTGPETPVLTDLVTASPGRGAVQLAVSDTGTLAWISSRRVRREVVLVERGGQPDRPEVLDLDPDAYSRPRFSPDGERLALVDGGDLLVYDLGKHQPIPLTDGQPAEDIPLWLNDEELLFSSMAEGPINLFVAPLYRDGPTERLLPKTPDIQYATSVSPDRRTVLYQQQSAATEWDIFAVGIEGDHEPRVLVQSRFPDTNAVFSPDGRYFAYTTNERGRYEVYVRPFDDPQLQREQVSAGGGKHPVWRGSEIFYLQPATSGATRSETLMVVDVVTEPELTIGPARQLMEAPFLGGQGRYPAYYDVSPDGRRFAFVRNSEQPPARTLNIQLDWFAELRRLAPAGPRVAEIAGR